jgi:hypothetical protein
MAREAAMAIEAIDDTDLTALLAYWTGKCGSRTMPRRADIDPTEIPSLLPYLFIAEIHHPLRFRFRLVGTAICQRWGENPTGKWLDELSFDGERQAVMEQYASVPQTSAPRFDVAEFVNERGRYLHYRRLLLPLSEDGRTANMLLGGQKAIGAEGYQVSVPKWI